jgi:predicted type IV restriction endonuclease
MRDTVTSGWRRTSSAEADLLRNNLRRSSAFDTLGSDESHYERKEHDMAIPAKVQTRVVAGLKKFQSILEAAKSRDVNESDTVVIVTDLLQYVFGYDKYSEITSEHAIKSTFCDLAIKLDGDLALLIEVKAIGLELKDNFVKQAIDYAANQGCDWVVLTNGIVWRVYKVMFAKPIDQELVLELNLLTLSHKDEEDLELLGLLTKEGWLKEHIKGYHAQRRALSRFSLAALLLSDSVINVLRRELRKLAPEVKVECEHIVEVLSNEVIKRETLEGEKADAARRLVARAVNKALKAKRSSGEGAAEAIQDTLLPASSTLTPT